MLGPLFIGSHQDAVVSLSGRFGNQLFQLSFGLYLKLILHKDISYIQRRSLLRGFLPAEITEEHPISSLIYDSEKLSDGFARELFLRALELLPNNLIDDRHAIETQEQSKDYSVPRVTRGHFQHYRYADLTRVELERRLRASKVFSRIFEDELNQIAVHVRLGDYVSKSKNQALYGVLAPTYYRQAVEYLVERLQLKTVVIVSDDPKIAIENLSGELNTIKGLSIKVSRGGLVDDFCAIASSRAVVLANSTFGWWAAWFAHSLRSIPVIYPYPWFCNQDMNGDGLSYPSWLRMPRTV